MDFDLQMPADARSGVIEALRKIEGGGHLGIAEDPPPEFPIITLPPEMVEQVLSCHKPVFKKTALDVALKHIAEPFAVWAWDSIREAFAEGYLAAAPSTGFEPGQQASFATKAWLKSESRAALTAWHQSRKGGERG